ncbi:uncharacterized protein LOC125801476 [Astyanax mexicanus]|uniref:uncharacterized protein LOC125801476 n=1 Tax=Astyanax mexicanus TaxID=7994 RepID=UPI0020CAE67D|nr:uncharacterized protein LOC125801476 [Astyanax mexicanus]
MSTDVKPEPAPAETTQDLTPNCSNTDCQRLLRENQELKARLGLGKGECPRQDCQHKSQELSRIAQLYMASPQKKLRNKFSRKDDFETEHAPKYEQVLQDFFVFCVGVNPSSKVKDNGKTCRSHVRRFLLFAGEGKLLKGDFSFLASSTKIAEWVEVLKTDRMKPTTIRINLVNIHKFFKFLNNLPATQTKLSMRDFQKDPCTDKGAPEGSTEGRHCTWRRKAVETKDTNSLSYLKYFSVLKVRYLQDLAVSAWSSRPAGC